MCLNGKVKMQHFEGKTKGTTGQLLEWEECLSSVFHLQFVCYRMVLNYPPAYPAHFHPLEVPHLSQVVVGGLGGYGGR